MRLGAALNAECGDMKAQEKSTFIDRVQACAIGIYRMYGFVSKWRSL